MMHYEIYRSLFFASNTAFIQKIDISNEIIIDFKESKITDMNAIDAVNKITER
jgi:sulfate permease, SulP family